MGCIVIKTESCPLLPQEAADVASCSSCSLLVPHQHLADSIIVMLLQRSIGSGAVLLLLHGAQPCCMGGIEFLVGDNAALLLGTASASGIVTPREHNKERILH